jgi:hypothetical protein
MRLIFSHGQMPVPPAEVYTVVERVCAAERWWVESRDVPAGTTSKVARADLLPGVVQATAAGISVFVLVHGRAGGRGYYRVEVQS